jgi:hypothetical protein
MFLTHPRNRRATIPMNKIQDSRFHPLFIPVVYVVTDRVDHDGAFWGIRFPVRSFSFDQTIIYIVQDHLEGGRHPVLKAGLQGPDLAPVLLAVVGKIDREFIKHTIGFREMI